MEVVMIKKFRKEKKLTQEQLAEQVDISWRHLQRLENNEDNTTIKTLRKIVAALDIPDEEVLHYIKKKSS